MTGSKFVVDFGDVQLPKDVADKLDRDIRQLVSHTIAGMDFHADDKMQFVIPKDIRGYRVFLEKDAIKRISDLRLQRPGG